MSLKKIIYLIVLIVHNVECEYPSYVNLVCSVIDRQEDLINHCSSSFLEIKSPTGVIMNVFDSAGSEVNTSHVHSLMIQTSQNSVNFMPARIKHNFPKLNQIEIRHSGLTHLEKSDMRQFGDSLVKASFRSNLLTSLEGDLFEYNPNIEYLIFSNNPIKFIDSRITENLKMIKIVDFVKCECVQGENFQKCNDLSVRNKSLQTINERKIFFFKEYLSSDYLQSLDDADSSIRVYDTCCECINDGDMNVTIIIFSTFFGTCLGVIITAVFFKGHHYLSTKTTDFSMEMSNVMYDTQDQSKSFEEHYAVTNEILTFQNEEPLNVNIYDELALKIENVSLPLKSRDEFEAKSDDNNPKCNIYQEVNAKKLRDDDYDHLKHHH